MSMAGASIKALCFDVFGTVTDWYSSVVEEGEELSAQLGVDVPWGEFVTKWRIDGYFTALFRIATGEMACIPTEEIHRRKLDDLLQEYGLEALAEEEINHFNLAWNRIRAWPDAARGLAAARKCGFRTAYVYRPLEYGPASQQEEKTEAFDYDASDFIELAQMLRRDRMAGII